MPGRVQVLRKPTLMTQVVAFLFTCDWLGAFLRRFLPILKLGDKVIVTRNDDVREVLLDHVHFHTLYADKLRDIMADQPFMMAFDDPADFHRYDHPLRQVIRPRDDLAALLKATEVSCAKRIAQAGGQLEVVDFVRQVTFDVFCPYLGVTTPKGENLQIMAMRLIEFLSFDSPPDPALRKAAIPIARTLRDHLDALIDERRKRGVHGEDVLGRCLAFQARGEPGFGDQQIRTGLMGIVFGGLPQPALAAPYALNELLARPERLREAMAAARAGRDDEFAAYVFEALRFDPIAPALQRRCSHDHAIAAGTFRGTMIGEGSTVILALRSAMMDPRRVLEPEAFDARRAGAAYLHFGAGLHSCFAEEISRTLVPAMLKSILRLEGLARHPGPRGELTKRAFFADELWVTFKPVGMAQPRPSDGRRRAGGLIDGAPSDNPVAAA